MSFAREFWTKSFSEELLPSWVCSKCQKGFLAVNPGSFHWASSGDDTAMMKTAYWEPDQITLKFSALLQCSNLRCQEPYSISGRGHIEENSCCDDSRDDYLRYYHAEFFSPAPLVFPIPKAIPFEIRRDILRAFGCFLGDPEAAGNMIRSAIEKVLDFQKISRFVERKRIEPSVGRAKKTLRSLHSRIEEFGLKHKDHAERLLAIKWIGNVGSHSEGVTIDNILDAFEILNFALDELFAQRTKRVSSLVKAINERKGPLKKRRKSSLITPS
jgi:hypothetical protein